MCVLQLNLAYLSLFTQKKVSPAFDTYQQFASVSPKKSGGRKANREVKARFAVKLLLDLNMEKLKSHFGAQPKYTPVDKGDQIEGTAENCQRDALQNNDFTREDRLGATDSWTNSRNRLTRIHYLAFFQGLVIAFLVLFIFFSHRRRAAGSGLLGVDPSGFVPQGQYIDTQQLS